MNKLSHYRVWFNPGNNCSKLVLVSFNKFYYLFVTVAYFWLMLLTFVAHFCVMFANISDLFDNSAPVICDRGARDVPRSHITGAAIAYHGKFERKMSQALLPQTNFKLARYKAF